MQGFGDSATVLLLFLIKYSFIFSSADVCLLGGLRCMKELKAEGRTSRIVMVIVPQYPIWNQGVRAECISLFLQNADWSTAQ